MMSLRFWHVLEHVHDLSGYMDHFRSILKPGGVPSSLQFQIILQAMQKNMALSGRHMMYPDISGISVQTRWKRLMTKHHFSLTDKIPMPLDAFYVSMLSEKYRGNDFMGSLAGFISGYAVPICPASKNVDNASSVIYIAK